MIWVLSPGEGAAGLGSSELVGRSGGRPQARARSGGPKRGVPEMDRELLELSGAKSAVPLGRRVAPPNGPLLPASEGAVGISGVPGPGEAARVRGKGPARLRLRQGHRSTPSVSPGAGGGHRGP